MARRLRFAPAEYPLHVTQRGNFGQRVFHSRADRSFYLELLERYAGQHRLRILGFCLMPNHVHLVVIPEAQGSLPELMSRLAGEYAQYVNGRLGRRGHLWAARYYACVLDRVHLVRALRYVDENPVRAHLAGAAAEYPWSSAAAHCGLESPSPFLDLAGFRERIEFIDWRAMLAERQPRTELMSIRRATRAERPLGEEGFVQALEDRFAVRLTPLRKKAGVAISSTGGSVAGAA